jgi:N-acetylneuraminic acid mutarotase
MRFHPNSFDRSRRPRGLRAFALVICVVVTATSAALASPSNRSPGWTTRAPMPTASGGLASTVAGGRIYALGGFNTGFAKALNTAQAYNPKTNRWHAVAPMPTARGNQGAATVDGQIYAIGGYDSNGNALATVESYDPATRSWRTRAPLPVATGGLAAAAHDGRIYAVGGFDQAGPALANLEIYDPTSNHWRSGAPMPTARGLLSVTWSHGRLYAIGGRDTNGKFLDAVYAYDPRTNKWQARARIPIPRSLPAVATLGDGQIVAAGGATTGKPPVSLSDVELYTPSSNTWQRLKRLPKPRAALTGAVYSGKVFLAIGGFVGGKDQASSLVESLVVHNR